MGMSMLVQRFNKLLPNDSLVEYFYYIQEMNKVSSVAEDALALLKPAHYSFCRYPCHVLGTLNAGTCIDRHHADYTRQ